MLGLCSPNCGGHAVVIIDGVLCGDKELIEIVGVEAHRQPMKGGYEVGDACTESYSQI